MHVQMPSTFSCWHALFHQKWTLEMADRYLELNMVMKDLEDQCIGARAKRITNEDMLLEDWNSIAMSKQNEWTVFLEVHLAKCENNCYR